MDKGIRVLGNRNVSVSTSTKFARGCLLCFGGQKSVIFITGLCDEGCFYCPVNRDYLYRDIMKVNERIVNSIEEITEEISRSGSRGASLTGGEPLKTPLKTLNVIASLKSNFGSRFHVHLYTTGKNISLDLAKTLERAGLDEIRFHPVKDEYLRKIERIAKHINIEFGIEVPAIPGNEKWILDLVVFAQRIGGKFVNINELEVSPGNVYHLVAKGFKINPDGISVKGSLETALNVIKKSIDIGLEIPIHICPAVYKDNVQTRVRFIRALNTHTEIYEKPSSIGTVTTVNLIFTDAQECLEKRKRLHDKSVIFKVRDEYYVHPDDFTQVMKMLKGCIREAYLIERHPDYSRTLISRAFISE